MQGVPAAPAPRVRTAHREHRARQVRQRTRTGWTGWTGWGDRLVPRRTAVVSVDTQSIATSTWETRYGWQAHETRAPVGCSYAGSGKFAVVEAGWYLIALGRDHRHRDRRASFSRAAWADTTTYQSRW